MSEQVDTRLVSGRLTLPFTGLYPRVKPKRGGEVWGDVRFRLAESRAELFAAFRLLQQRYQAAGLARAGHPIRVEPFHLWPQSQVCVALHGEQVVGCVTVVRSGRFELPSQRSHADALRSLPASSCLAEATSFAISERCGRHSLEMILGLTRLVQRFGLHNGVDHLLAVVHPRHARFYERAVGFRRVGKQLPCERVEGNPGVAMLGKIDDADACRMQWQATFSPSADDDPEHLRPRYMTPSQRAYFANFLPRDSADRRAA